MELSKSKLALAKVINESGGWFGDAENAAQDRDGDVDFYSRTPVRTTGREWWSADGLIYGSRIRHDDAAIKNWHQTILSREEYYHAYPKADADWWIEWKGGMKSPVESGVPVDVKTKDGNEYYDQLLGDACWHNNWGDANIIAYRLHKQEVKPEFCESVTHGIPEPESIDGLCAKVTEENKHQHVDAKPTIEQLAQDYRDAKDYADRLQKEAGEAAVKAESLAVEIRKKIIELHELIGISKPKQEPELVIADWRDLRVGDDVECIEDNIGNKYSGAVGVVLRIDYDDTSTPVCVDIDGVGGIWCHKVKLIRRT